MMITQSLLSRLREQGGPERCMQHYSKTTLTVPQADIVVGVCMYVEFGLRCQEPSGPAWSCHARTCVPTSAFVATGIRIATEKNWECTFLNGTCLPEKGPPKDETPHEQVLRCMKFHRGVRMYPSFHKEVTELLACARSSPGKPPKNTPVSMHELVVDFMRQPCLGQEAKSYLLGGAMRRAAGRCRSEL